MKKLGKVAGLAWIHSIVYTNDSYLVLRGFDWTHFSYTRFLIFTSAKRRGH